MSFALVRAREGRPPIVRGVAAVGFASAPLVLAACAVTTLIALASTATGDYMTHGSVAGDNAGPAIAALLHGDLGSYLAHQPAIGLTSIVLRLPFAGLASLLGGGDLEIYRLGAVACLLPLGLLAAWLAGERRSASIGPVGRLPGLLAGAVVLLSPAVVDAVHTGHPEEVLAAVLATAAVIAAIRGHSSWAAVMLGLAVGTKPWALIAVLPVFVAVPGERVRIAVIAGGLAAVLSAAAPLADPAAAIRAIHGEGSTHRGSVFSLLWPVSSAVHLSSGVLAPARSLPLGMTRGTASLLAIAVALPLLALRWNRARRRGDTCDPLALLALFGILRCACDSTHLEYYYLAALIPLAAWEAVNLRRLPLATVVASAGVALLPGGALHASGAVLNAASTVGTLILVGYVASRAFYDERAGGPSHRRGFAWQPTTDPSAPFSTSSPTGCRATSRS
jgi:hypothetical protein